jgi:hypothetical protein
MVLLIRPFSVLGFRISTGTREEETGTTTEAQRTQRKDREKKIGNGRMALLLPSLRLPLLSLLSVFSVISVPLW